MHKCEHKFGLKKRDSGELYCPVCRGIIYEDDLNSRMKEGTGWWVTNEQVKGIIKKI